MVEISPHVTLQASNKLGSCFRQGCPNTRLTRLCMPARPTCNRRFPVLAKLRVVYRRMARLSGALLLLHLLKLRRRHSRPPSTAAAAAQRGLQATARLRPRQERLELVALQRDAALAAAGAACAQGGGPLILWRSRRRCLPHRRRLGLLCGMELVRGSSR